MGTQKRELQLQAIGTVETPFPQPAGTPLGPSRADAAKGTVWIDEPYRAALRDLEGFDRVWLIYWLDRAPAARLAVTPFLDTQERGLFATRSPARINPIGISAVRLLGVYADHIEVADVDIVDGTPLLDIKPYVPEFDSYSNSKAGWFDLTTVQRKVADGRYQAQPVAVPMSELRLSISGMHCTKCPPKIKSALEELPGVSVREIEMGSATVEFDATATTAAAILQVLEVLKFSATVIS
jgi:tRNA-Thr(GGU) m(6)t(6)A37 methyltransferase TsaA